MERRTRIGIPSLEGKKINKREGGISVKRARQEGRELIEEMLEHENRILASLDDAHAGATELLNQYYEFMVDAGLSEKAFQAIKRLARSPDEKAFHGLKPEMKTIVLKCRGLMEVEAQIAKISKALDEKATTIEDLIDALESIRRGGAVEHAA